MNHYQSTKPLGCLKVYLCKQFQEYARCFFFFIYIFCHIFGRTSFVLGKSSWKHASSLKMLLSNKYSEDITWVCRHQDTACYLATLSTKIAGSGNSQVVVLWKSNAAMSELQCCISLTSVQWSDRRIISILVKSIVWPWPEVFSVVRVRWRRKSSVTCTVWQGDLHQQWRSRAELDETDNPVHLKQTRED